MVNLRNRTDPPSPKQLDSAATSLGIGRNAFSGYGDGGSNPPWVL